MNIYETIRSEIGGYDGIAVIDRGQEFSYHVLFRAADALGVQFREAGMTAFARVGLLADDSCEYIAASLAVLSLNAALVPLSTRAAESERERMPDELELNFLLVSEPYRKEGDQPLLHGLFLRILKKEIRKIELPDGRVPAFIRFSSGTTGGSKGVVLSHRAVIERTSACVGLGVTRGEYVFWVKAP